MFLFELQEEQRCKEADTYTASTRFCLWDVTYHNFDTYENWRYLIDNRFSRHVWLETYLRWSHKLPNPKLIVKKCKIITYFDAKVYDLLSLKDISLFFLMSARSGSTGYHNSLSNKISSIAHHNTLTVLCTQCSPEAWTYLKLKTRQPNPYHTLLDCGNNPLLKYWWGV